LYSLFAVTLVLVLLFPQIVSAAGPNELSVADRFGNTCGGGVGDIGCNVGYYIGSLLLLIVSALGDFFATIAAFFATAAHWMIGYSTHIMDLPAVTSGFTITLQAVNLLFVMGLIISAFQIIFGLGEGSARKTIGLIILAAVLVNFSLLIAGFLLDIGNVFTNFFINGFTAKSLGDAFNNGSRLNQIIPAGLTGSTGGDFMLLMQIGILRLILMLIVAIAMLSTFVMALVRNIWVAGLLIVMPLSWGFWGFPFAKVKSYHQKWWDHFINWGLVYLPSMTFFLWLAVSTSKLMYAIEVDVTTLSPKSDFAGVMGQSMDYIVQLLILVGLVIMGLKISQSAGGFGSKLGMNLASGAGKFGKKLGIGAARGVYRGTGAQYAVKKSASGISRAATWSSKFTGAAPTSTGGKWLKRAANVITLGALPVAQGLTTAGLKKTANATGGFAKYDKAIEDLRKSDLAGLSDNSLNAYKATSKLEHAAWLAEVSARGKIDDFASKPDGAAKVRASALTARDVMPEKIAKEIVAADPRLTVDLLRSKQDDVKKLTGTVVDGKKLTEEDARGMIITKQVSKMSAAKIAELSADVLDNSPEGQAVFAGVLNHRAGLQAIVRAGGEIHQKVKDKIDKDLMAQSADIKAYYVDDEKRLGEIEGEIKAASDARDTALVKNLHAEKARLIGDRKNMMSSATAPDRAKQLMNARQAMNETITKRTDLELI